MSEEMIVADYAEFITAVARQCAIAVDRLIVTDLPVALLERAEYRRRQGGLREDDSRIDEVTKLCVKSATGEEALIESAINTVRLSLRITWDGPDGCILTKTLQSRFFARLGRADIKSMRKEPVKGYDVSLVFTTDDLGSSVESLLVYVLTVWRQLTRHLRLHQVTQHRRAGLGMFERLLKVLPDRTPASPKREEQPVATSPSKTHFSHRTECHDFGTLEEIEDMISPVDDQFIIN